jgi:hypothetical protein
MSVGETIHPRSAKHKRGRKKANSYQCQKPRTNMQETPKRDENQFDHQNHTVRDPRQVELSGNKRLYPETKDSFSRCAHCCLPLDSGI